MLDCVCILKMLFVVFYMCPAQLYQSIPENRTVCAGEKLQYTCSTSQSSLTWEIGSDQHPFDNNDAVNAMGIVGTFDAVLIEKNGSFFSSTLTNAMVSSSYNGLIVTCIGGDEHIFRSINITGKYMYMCVCDVIFAFSDLFVTFTYTYMCVYMYTCVCM